MGRNIMKKKILSTISLIMTVIMIMLSLLVDALAYQLTHTNSTSFELEELDLNTLTIEYEDETKRTQKEKHFKLSDGSYLAVQYNEPVHFLSEEGTWKDFDNTLSLEGAENTDDFTGYVNTEGDFKTKFTDKANSDILFKISDVNNENTISFELNESDVNAVFGSVFEDVEVFSFDDEVSEEGSILEQNKEILNLDKLSSQIDYEDMFEDVDFQYIVTTTGVKENIIVNDKRDNYDFSFIVNTGSLVAVQNEDGSISINSETETKYIIPAPFMYDDAGTRSDSVTYTLSMIDNGRYELCVDAAEGWVNDSDRVFPVTIDPVVTTITDGYAELYAASVSSEGNEANNISIGKDTSGETWRTYVNWTELPYLKAYDKVVSAQLYYKYDTASSSEMIVEAHRVSSEWAPGTITWENKPAVDDIVLDYTSINAVGESEYLIWDITDVAHEWYANGDSNGVALVASNNSVNGMISLNDNAENEPYVLVQYRCQNGLEDNYTYTTLEAGISGNAYINNYTGTLTYVYDMFDSESSSMPIDLDLIYNSAISDRRFSGYDYMNTCMYDNMNLGDGWKLSAQETIVPVEILEMGLLETEYDYAYIYCDRDGTEHYFYLDNAESETDAATEPAKYVDESGLGMTLVHNEDNNQYVITFSDESTKTFKIITETRHDGEYYANGYLISEADSKNNTIIYTYDSTYPTRLVSITDDTGCTVALGYDTSGYFNKVTAGERVITIGFEYGWGNRFENYKSVSDSYGSTTSFTYNESLATISSADGAVTSFEYEPASYFDYCYRIKTASWKSGAAATANTAEFTYDRSHATTVHYYGNDCVNCETGNSIDDLYLTYIFDKWANNTLFYTENYSREIVYNTSIYGYSQIKNTKLNSNDFKITEYANLGMVGVNYIIDGNIENESFDAFVTNEGISISVTDAEKYCGKNALCVSSIESNRTNGFYIFAELPAGRYTYSAYIKQTTPTDGEIIIEAQDAEGNILVTNEEVCSTISEVNNGWQRVSLDFCLEDYSGVKLVIGLKDSVGTFYADAIQLENQTEYTPSSFNMVNNSGFELGYDSITLQENTTDASNSWNIVNGEYISNCEEIKFNDKAICLFGGSTSYFSQTISINSSVQNSYILSGWAKANSVIISNEERKFELFASVDYTYTGLDGVCNTGTVTTSIPFAWESDEWQYVSGVINLPKSDGVISVVSIDDITIGGCYNNNCNIAIFDNISMVQDSAVKVYYNEDGNITSVDQNGMPMCSYEYDNNENIYRIRNENGEIVKEYTYDEFGNVTTVYSYTNSETFSYTYDVNGNLISITQNGVVIEQNTYDSNGKLTMSVTENGYDEYEYSQNGDLLNSSVTRTIDGIEKTMYSAYTYDSTSGNVSSIEDSFENITYYDYNISKWIELTQDAKGNQTMYTYDFGRLGCIYSDKDKDGVYDDGEASVSYDYDVYGRLCKIQTDTAIYLLSYNAANLPQSITVEGQSTPFITYRYNETYTSTVGISYSDGLTFDFEYDILGNIKSVRKDGVLSAEYEYNCNMQTVFERDVCSNTERKYRYDDHGELYLTETYQNGINIKEYYRDTANGNREKITNINGYELNYKSIDGSSDKESTYVLPSNVHISTKKDAFGRICEIVFKNPETDGENNTGEVIFTITYTYQDEIINDIVRTSNRVSSIIYGMDDNITYTYEYDELGNIKSVSDGTSTTTYVYDDMNRLSRENNQKAGKTWKYIYDNSGNIQKRYRHPYKITGILGTDTLDPHSEYDYKNNTWGDILTMYHNTPINYDSYGNPTSWRDNMNFSWSGTQLDSITQSGNAIQYTYDSYGRITKKTAGEDTYDYVWQNGKLIAESFCDGLDVQYYLYDENGSPVAFSYLDEYYYYIKNQQGDILGFTDDEGNLLVTYYYDAWGDLLSTNIYTDKAYLAEYNSLRFRGYLYDIYSGLYYINGRYYDPKIGRYISANNQVASIGSNITANNQFAYCLDNPVNYNESEYVSYQNTVVSSVLNKPGFSRPNIANKTESVLSVMYNVPLYYQGWYSLCWAFCEVMVRDFYDEIERTPTEATNKAIELAKEYHKDKINNLANPDPERYWNQGGWPTNIYKDYEDIYTLIQLYLILANYGPVYAYYQGVDIIDGIEKHVGHVVVVVGVDFNNGYIYTNNPNYVEEGVGCQTFTEFLNGYFGMADWREREFIYIDIPYPMGW